MDIDDRIKRAEILLDVIAKSPYGPWSGRMLLAELNLSALKAEREYFAHVANPVAQSCDHAWVDVRNLSNDTEAVCHKCGVTTPQSG